MSELSMAKKKELAERMFINDGKTAKQIAEEIEVSEQSISRWRKGKKGEQDWDTRRAVVISAPHRIKEILLVQLEKIANGEKPDVDSDALAKVSKVIESISGKVSVQVTISVLKEFDDWMIDQDPEMAVKFLPYHKKFILYKAAQQ